MSAPTEERYGPRCKCGQQSVERTAIFTHLTSFWYCRKCKVEVFEPAPESVDYSNFWDEEYNAYYNSWTNKNGPI